MATTRQTGITPLRLMSLLAGIAIIGISQASAAPPDAHTADFIQVTLDQAKLVKLPTGAETIVIGNPAIADVTVQKNGVMVITGRTAGRTNFIALDSAGAIISESTVTVTNMTQGRVVILRGTDQSSYDCAPNCLPTVALGDEDKHFGKVVDQATRRDSMANQSQSAAQTQKR